MHIMNYSKRYARLNEPIELPNGKVLHNRLISGCSHNNHVQGALEPYPTDDIITYYANRAKNGASLLVMTGMGDKYFVEGYTRPGKVVNQMKDVPQEIKDQHIYSFFDWFNFYDCINPKYHGRFTKLTEEVHLHQGLILNQILPCVPPGYDVSAGKNGFYAFAGQEAKELTIEQIQEMIDEYVKWAIAEKRCGFDGIEIYIGHEFTLLARFLSPTLNKRTDKYGGSLENRVRPTIELCQAIKKACGDDFIIMVRTEPGGRPGHATHEEMIEFTKMLEGYVDIISIFHPDLINDRTHASYYDADDHYPAVKFAAAIKAGGTKIPVASIGGFCDPDDMENFLKQGLFDICDCARPWISNPEYGKCITEGRGEDVIPCLRCNKCHMKSVATTDVWCIAACSVNPTWGLENRIERLSDAPTCKQSVGIVGGGPAGMRAALYAAERGHDVTIYEKSMALGGLLNCVDGIDFKWTLTRYKEWLIYQVRKNPNIHVELNMEVTREFLAAKGHDAVLVAIGADVRVPNIPGIENAGDCYSFMREKKEAGKNVVIIGGGDVGIDCGMDLAKRGHNVTVLEAGILIAAHSAHMHTYAQLMLQLTKLPNMKCELKVNVTNITSNSVEYIDADGNTQIVEADTILYSTGLAPRTKDALKLTDSSAYKCYTIGDCKNPASLCEHNRDAFGAANML